MVDNQIKKLRLAKGMSQEQLAEKANVSVRTVQRLEAGDDASISTLNLVAGALGVEVGDLFTKTSSTQQRKKSNQRIVNFSINYKLVILNTVISNTSIPLSTLL